LSRSPHLPRNLVPATPDAVFYVCRRMRADEIEQLRAFYSLDDANGKFDADAVAIMLLNKQGPRYTVLQDDGTPAVCFGLEMIVDGVWQPWMAGTAEGWERNWRAITKGCRWVLHGIFNLGARRLEMSAIESRVQTHEWYQRALKMTPEGVKRKFGRNGENVHLFAVLAEDV
jgi:hypothetical protein